MRLTESDYRDILARLAPKKPTPPPASESSLHNQVREYCRLRKWVCLTGSMAHRTHRTVGEPDMAVLADNGVVLWIECKTAKGKLSPAQQAMKHWMETLGHTMHVIRSMDDFTSILRDWDLSRENDNP